MRTFTLAAVFFAGLAGVAANPARADSTLESVGREALRLDLDPDLFADAARVLVDNTQASSTLPAVMGFGRGLNAPSSNSGGGGGGGALSGVGIGLQVGTPTAITLKVGASGKELGRAHD